MAPFTYRGTVQEEPKNSEQKREDDEDENDQGNGVVLSM
jgi:hypothetical protein